MDDSSQRKINWTIGIAVLSALLFLTDLSPFKHKSPDWQVIMQAVSSTVACSDWELGDDGVRTNGFGPCVRLVNVTYDRSVGDEYCYSADVEIGGVQNEAYGEISSWELLRSEYYCVGWHATYGESDVNEPDDWSIDFGSDSPANLL